ncbi:CLUMA_CG007504, isoform A [Clunio marinus]|uniref:CLUMA_CG007504, isoform A n=1 Tax=Clunio marinus TaxID=568069 RepID=A0A1J1I2I6_9DIPT|nr:CLUMA_CG007504, isoform A [Clunio marinus]
MHFWIDKRSNYGIGYNRSMAGLSYQHRRLRSKSLVTPMRQYTSSPPSTSQHHLKSHHLHYHHRHRLGDFEQHRLPPPLRAQHSSNENRSNASSFQANNYPTPVIHSVHPRDESTINHVDDLIHNTRRNSVINNWLPIYLKGVICITTAIILLALKLYYDNELTTLQLVTFCSMSILFMVFTTIISLLRIGRNRLTRSENFHEQIIEPSTMASNQITTQSNNCDTIELPPPYHVALTLPDKNSSFKCEESPPPSYDKINII